MQLKPITAIIVLSLVVASLLVAGCTAKPQVDVTAIPNERVGYVSTDYPASGRSQLVEACVNARQAASVIWHNNTAATETVKSKSSLGNNVTWFYTYEQFPTAQAASAYFDSQRGTYTYKPTEITPPITYYDLTGHDPTVYKQLTAPSANFKDGRDFAEITQYDALISEDYAIVTSPTNQA